MQELYVLTERVNNHGEYEYEDFWHAERAVGVYSSFESAMQIVRVFKQSAIAYCEAMADENYKFLDLEKTDSDTFVAAWCIDTKYDQETTDFKYFIEKITVDNHGLRFKLPDWLYMYEKEEE